MFSIRPLPVMPTRQRALVTPNHTACCPCLNSITQPWPLPDGNHSPGTATVNSSRTTELLLQFLTGQGDEPHLLFQGAQIMFPTVREVIDGHIRALLFKAILFYSWGRGQGMGSGPSSQGLPSAAGGCPGTSRCGSENSHQHC